MTRTIELPGPRAGLVPSLALWALLSLSPALAAAELDQQCVLRLAETGDDSLTLADMRKLCGRGDEPIPDVTRAEREATPAAAAEGPVEQRLADDREDARRPFSIMAHRPNYFLAATWNSEGWNPDLYRRQYNDSTYRNQDIETQFQVSIKVPLAIGLLDGRMDLYGAYTNRSFWQVYSGRQSEPFRETNHEPELWAQFRNEWTVFGWKNSVNTAGYVHQSNGQSGLLSRGWDRLYATFVFERGRWVLAFKPWIWLETDKADSDNPDIDDYLGQGEVHAIYGRHGQVFSVMLRNQLESGFERGAVELSWSFPVFDYPYLRGYVQYFYGYGESLIDYNQRANRLGIGISVTDWLD